MPVKVLMQGLFLENRNQTGSADTRSGLEQKMTESLEGLVNLGFEVIRGPERTAPEKTIIVLGVARGGTSMVAAALFELGIPLGVNDGSVVYEDVELARAMESGDTGLLKSVISDRNSKHAVWGFKRPSTSAQINRIAKLFRNPHFVVVFRDVFAIASRNKIAVSTDPFRNMISSLKQYRGLLDFLESSRYPAMLVSYEKALLKREPFVQTLAQFVGVTEKEAVNRAFDAVEPEPSRYLRNARLTDTMGYLDRIGKDRVHGWAKPTRGHEPVTVELYINGNKTMEATADRLRQDVKDRGVHPTGLCGFIFDLSGKVELKHGDVIAVRAKGEIQELNASPKTFRP